MATETPDAATTISAPPDPGPAETVATAAAPAATANAVDSIQPPESAPSVSSGFQLPPRVDPGQNVDDVLGEVSKLFGQAGNDLAPPVASPPVAVPPASPAPADDINEDLNDLIAAGAPAPTVALAAEPSKEMKLGTAADLFRSSPDEPPVPAPSAAEPKPAASSPAKPEAPTAAGKLSALRGVWNKLAHSVANLMNRLRGLFDRVPSRFRLPAAMAVTLLMGLIAGASLHRSRAHETAPVATNAERTAEKSAEHAEESSKAAALEEQLQQAVAERSAAQQERDKALGRLKLLEAQPHGGKPSEAAKEQEQAARRKAEATYRAAEDQIHLWELRTYDAQLARVRDVWRRNPGLALALLQDADRCPARLRDFTWRYFYGRAKNDRATLYGHAGRVNAVAWSPDGKRIASCGQDGLVKFWDAGSGKEIASVAAHAGGTTALTYSQRGDLLATGGIDGTVKLWEVESRKLVATFFGHLGGVRGVALSPDATSLASASDDGTVRFWDVASRRLTATRWGNPRSGEPAESDDPSQFVRAITYSPDGLLVASGGHQLIRIWDAATAVERTRLAVDEGSVNALAFSPQGTTLAAGTAGKIYRWDVDSLVPRSIPLVVEGRVNSLKYSTDGRILAAATEQGGLLFSLPAERASTADSFLPAAGKPLRLDGHVGSVTGIALAPSGETAVTCGEDGTLRLWNPRDGGVDKVDPDTVIRRNRPAVAVSYSADGKRFAAAGPDAITLWNVSDGVETARLKNQSGDLTRLAFSPDGKHLASSSKDWPILLWDLGEQRVAAALNGHTAAVNSVNYSSDGKLLISASDDGTVRLWDAASNRELATLAGSQTPVLCACLAPDGKLAAAAGAELSVRLWDVAQKQVRATLTGHRGPIVGLAFSPDGRFLVSAEDPRGTAAGAADVTTRPLRLWRLPAGELVRDFGTRGFAALVVVFSPDGKTLATSDREGVTLWNPESGEPRETLRFAAAGAFSPLAFSPNGLTLAAGGKSAIVFWSTTN